MDLLRAFPVWVKHPGHWHTQALAFSSWIKQLNQDTWVPEGTDYGTELNEYHREGRRASRGISQWNPSPRGQECGVVYPSGVQPGFSLSVPPSIPAAWPASLAEAPQAFTLLFWPGFSTSVLVGMLFCFLSTFLLSSAGPLTALKSLKCHTLSSSNLAINLHNLNFPSSLGLDTSSYRKSSLILILD